MRRSLISLFLILAVLVAIEAVFIISILPKLPDQQSMSEESVSECRNCGLANIEEKANSIVRRRMLCWDSAVEMQDYLDSIGIKNSIVTCEINICQNVEPDNIFYSTERREMGYYYNGTWFSEDDCIRAHVINGFEMEGATFYVDVTRSSNISKSKDLYWKCFRY